MAANLIGFEDIPHTIPHFCIESFRRNAKPDALSFKVDNVWKRLSGAEIIERIKRIALGLSALGVKAGDRVAIISENRPEWSLVDIAILSLRAVNVPIYTTQAVDQIRYILENSGAKMLFISGKKLFKHAEDAIRSVERLEKLVFFGDDFSPEKDGRAITLAKVEEQGIEQDKIDPNAFERGLAEVKAGDLATIIYTSGTTGEPKGVMLTHENFVSNIVAISGGLPIRSTDRSLAVLPLSHIFERAVFYVLCSNGVAIHNDGGAAAVRAGLSQDREEGEIGRRLENASVRMGPGRRAGILGGKGHP
jgi:long-chain acyl-CoA synthetase